MSIEAKLEELGLTLPQPLKAPPGVVLPFSWVRVRGNRAFVSGHIALNADGSIAQPLGKVGAELTLEQGCAAAHATGLAILASLKRELNDLDRIAAWLRVFGMVNAAPTFDRFPLVINGFSDLILDLFDRRTPLGAGRRGVRRGRARSTSNLIALDADGL